MGKKKQNTSPDQYIHDLRHAADGKKRQSAAKALAEYGDDESAIALLAALSDDPEPGVRISAARALAKRDDPRAAEPLICAFNKALPGYVEDAHSEFDEYARILGRLKDTRSLPALIAGLSSDKPKVREKVRDILLNEAGQAAMPSLAAELENQDYRILTGAASILSKLGFKVTQPLLDALASPRPATRMGAAIALGDLGAKKAVLPLVAALRDDDIRVVQAAARSLGRLDDRRATDPLLSLLRSDQVPVRKASVEALGSLRDPKALDPLIASLTEEALAEDAGKSIAQFGPAAISPLIACFRDESEIVRERASRILGQIGPQCVVPLVGCLADPDSHVRLAATRTLGLIDFNWVAFKEDEWGKTLAAAIEGLLPVISDKDQDVRKNAFLSLGTLGGILFRGCPFYHDHPLAGKVLDTLTGALSDKDVQVRAWAATALGLFGAQECVAPLRTMLRGQDELVKEAAADALRRIPEKKVVSTPVPGRKDPEPHVRHAPMGRVSLDHGVISDYQLNNYNIEPSFRKERGPPKMSRPPAPAPAAPPSSSQPEHRAGKGPTADMVIETKTIDTAEPRNAEMSPPSAPEPAVPFPPSSKPEHKAEKEIPADTDIGPATAGAAEPRYTDTTFYHDDMKSKLAPGEPLKLERAYRLEVAIRTKRTGVLSTDNKDEPIREPMRDHPMTIMVTAESESKSFRIEEPVKTFILPPSGNTPDPAWFRVWATQETTNKEFLAELTLRLYCDFFLLAKFSIEAEVVRSDPPVSRFGLDHPVRIDDEHLGKESPDWANIRPRDMNISVKKEGETYQLRFLFHNNVNKEIEFTAPLRLNELDCEDELLRVRKILTGIAMRPTFARHLEGDEYEFPKCVRRLADVGWELWGKLFRQDNDSALFNIGDWLESHPLPEDSTIQISSEDKDSDLIFPWALLYDREPQVIDDLDPNLFHSFLQGFWGLRYCIEQRMFDTRCRFDKDIPTEDSNNKPRLCFMLWDQFENANAQKLLFRNLTDKSLGRIEMDDPIIGAPQCFNELENGNCHIFYFYTHGYTRPREIHKSLEAFYQLFMARYENIKRDDPRKEMFKFFYTALKSKEYETTRSRIELTNGIVYLDKLKKIRRFKKEPIVFLNMCESAEVIPTMKDSFVQFFLDRGAVCVIGTECPMTTEFAHPYSEKFFKEFVKGECVGKAALLASRYFMYEKKNPLGLAYTVYGSVMPKFKPPPIQ